MLVDLAEQLRVNTSAGGPQATRRPSQQHGDTVRVRRGEAQVVDDHDKGLAAPRHVPGDGERSVWVKWRFEQPEENAQVIEAITITGAYIMGRNMFGPGRGDWDLEWTGWWGDEPPYHAPVFVLTHHEREPVVRGETTVTFVTEGVEAARAAAGDREVAIAGERRGDGSRHARHVQSDSYG